ncbi:MAG: cold shock domain-containing protein [Candidatus Marinimicrobia bacterium]|nr:cold shock domain-containing protein [Candidatus Neomarinimicrobiota bacterium]
MTGDDGEDYFLHVSGLRDYLQQRGVRPRHRVAFDVDFDQKGDKAINVKAI